MTLISDDISQAIRFLNEGNVIAIPTETVYGLAANIFNENAIKKIFETKNRPLFNPLIVHLSSVDRVQEIAASFPEKAKLLAEKFWPGPLTLVLDKKPNIPDLITAGKSTIAVRVPKHPITHALLSNLEFPLAAPSANPFNRISPTESAHVASYFDGKIPMILEGGPCKSGIESTIIGFQKGEPIVYRFGSLNIETIEAVVGKLKIQNKMEAAPDAPGMLPKHYAPRTKTILVTDVKKVLNSYNNASIGILSFQEKYSDKLHSEVLSKNGDLAEAASNLYGALHRLDRLNLDIIIAEQMPQRGLGISINDRLRRATS